MTAWWNSLAVDLQIFFGIGIIALLVTVVQMFLTLVGLGAEAVDLDVEFDTADADHAHSSGIGLFSSQTLAAFFLGFGWVGAMLRTSGISVVVTVGAAFAIGVALMFAMFYMLKSLLRLQSKGNLDYATAVGEEGVVYVTIPGANQDGGGQIQVMIQGRLTTAGARKVTPGALKPGEKVRVVDTVGATAFVVEAI